MLFQAARCMYSSSRTRGPVAGSGNGLVLLWLFTVSRSGEKLTCLCGVGVCYSPPPRRLAGPAPRRRRWVVGIHKIEGRDDHDEEKEHEGEGNHGPLTHRHSVHALTASCLSFHARCCDRWRWTTMRTRAAATTTTAVTQLGTCLPDIQ